MTNTSGQVIDDVFHPGSYPPLGFKSPIVTWGYGTNATPAMVSVLLSHLASYGFTVIASTLANTGSGDEIDKAAHYLVTQDSVPGSVFAGHLDVSEAAAAGASQGAGGAVRPAALTQPVFFISTHGSLDSIIASPATEKAFFASTAVHAALGIIRNSDGRPADHNSVQNPAFGGNPDGELGYATAWLEYQLRHSTTAAAAFTGTHPELLSNSNWPGRARNNAVCPGPSAAGSVVASGSSPVMSDTSAAAVVCAHTRRTPG